MPGGRALLSALIAALVLPVPARADEDERARIAAERQRIDERHAADTQDCRARFAVNACLEEAQARRRAALEPLRRRELDLDDAARRRRAAEREQAVERTRQETLVRPPAPEAAAPPVRPPPPAASAVVAPRPAARPDGDAASAAARRAEAARERRAAAAAEREKIRRREAERQARQKPSDPLPTPALPAR